jgi:hypothetical protein
VLSAIVIASTLVPKGAFSLNPKMISDSALMDPMDPEHQGADTSKDQGDDGSIEKLEKPVKSTDIGAMIG